MTNLGKTVKNKHFWMLESNQKHIKLGKYVLRLYWTLGKNVGTLWLFSLGSIPPATCLSSLTSSPNLVVLPEQHGPGKPAASPAECADLIRSRMQKNACPRHHQKWWQSRCQTNGKGQRHRGPEVGANNIWSDKPER